MLLVAHAPHSCWACAKPMLNPYCRLHGKRERCSKYVYPGAVSADMPIKVVRLSIGDGRLGVLSICSKGLYEIPSDVNDLDLFALRTRTAPILNWPLAGAINGLSQECRYSHLPTNCTIELVAHSLPRKSLWATYRVCSSLSIFIQEKLTLNKLSLKKPVNVSFHVPADF
jgi:hypothetical protein